MLLAHSTTSGALVSAVRLSFGGPAAAEPPRTGGSLPPVGYNALVTGRLTVPLPADVDANKDDDDDQDEQLTPEQLKRVQRMEAELLAARCAVGLPLEHAPPVPPADLPRIAGEVEAYGTKTPCPDVRTARAIAEWIRAHQRADWRIHLAALEEHPAPSAGPLTGDGGGGSGGSGGSGGGGNDGNDGSCIGRSGSSSGVSNSDGKCGAERVPSSGARYPSERKAGEEPSDRVLLVHRYIMERPLEHTHSPAFAAVPLRYVYACWGPALPLMAHP